MKARLAICSRDSKAALHQQRESGKDDDLAKLLDMKQREFDKGGPKKPSGKVSCDVWVLFPILHCH